MRKAPNFPPQSLRQSSKGSTLTNLEKIEALYRSSNFDPKLETFLLTLVGRGGGKGELMGFWGGRTLEILKFRVLKLFNFFSNPQGLENKLDSTSKIEIF